jgi:uncharacterized protein (TIGR02246 family)
MKLLKSLLLLLIMVISTTTVPAGIEESSAIDELNTTWGKVFMRGDTEALLRMYTDNAVMLPPSSEILTDHNAIKGYWDNLKSVGVTDYVIYPVDLRVVGNIAYQSALWKATRTTSDGNVIQFDGNISNVLEKQKDGSWKIKLQSWN